ncbi:hypothetical protein FGU65_06515 [Methanoculleus sp. FWC-SCC1]|uniref:SAM-dependent methyltransferase n=1 Tax=Methanoculleus frigidifontis TaxID=2584085 RepID=A0ABT8M9D7_9EURY|nr:hypothetical protein [Methanoculleus sp. FWC-SCC1]MDN7024542.1 hypothetical protein [Methanoculleus sp. FWC-SCC1]
MTIAELLELDDCRLVEPSFAELTEDFYTGLLLRALADEARLLLDEEEEPLALALHDDAGWHAVSFLFRPPTLAALECFEAIGGDLYQVPKEDWLHAVREFYSNEICRTVLPAFEDLSGDRPGMIADLIREVWGGRTGDLCLDCCCGSGVGTAALRACGMRSLAYDNDPALLSLGLSRGRLIPGETLLIDGTAASTYVNPAPLGAALMAGEIHSYNADLWEQIIDQLLALVDEALVTVGTEPEVVRVEAWCAERGRETEVFENERDPLYDRWCCVARRI